MLNNHLIDINRVLISKLLNQVFLFSVQRIRNDTVVIIWWLVNGQWSLFSGHRSVVIVWWLVNGQWSLFNGHRSMVIIWWLVNGQWSLFNGHRSMVSV